MQTTVPAERGDSSTLDMISNRAKAEQRPQAAVPITDLSLFTKMSTFDAVATNSGDSELNIGPLHNCNIYEYEPTNKAPW